MSTCPRRWCPRRSPVDRCPPALDDRLEPGVSQVVDGPGGRAYVEFMAIDWRKHISSDPGMHHGQPTIRGMRISVSDVLDNLGSGMSVEQLPSAFPELTRSDVQACLIYAAEQTRRVAHA